ncbi:MAG TPA: L-histidine N(alpha)-methyltransferase [Burkholderiales bacterium]
MTFRAYTLHDPHLRDASLQQEVLAGLSAPRKSLPPKLFYDSRGSELFEQICRLPEYYPTRTEMQIMRDAAPDMATRVGKRSALIEYGSGSGLKTRVRLDALQPVAYIPIDIAAEQLTRAAAQVAQAFPGVEVIAVCADYTQPLQLPALDGMDVCRRAVYFSGSTIGNFTPDEAVSFLRRAQALVRAGGAMLIGVDLKKDAAVLHAAYNDAQGVTAAFNLNLLQRLNRELRADFDVSAFAHEAFYNADAGRIEMHLASRRKQDVTVAGRHFHFEAGETIHTENSYKYSIEEFHVLVRRAGFSPQHCWTDAASRFSVHYLVADA